jgi:hypothetical protein
MTKRKIHEPKKTKRKKGGKKEDCKTKYGFQQ